MRSGSEPVLGLRPNLLQFALLAADNVLVGMLIGSERTVVPLLGQQSFHVTSLVVLLSFIAAFGVVKGPLNLLAGALADRVGRRRVLLAGWVAGLPVPWLLLLAPTWAWVVAANLLAGINQGLAWTMTVTSKIDLVGPRQRGLALGINEFSGYLGVALASSVTGDLAARYGLRPAPFVLAAAVSAAGLLLPLVAVRETLPFARLEAGASPPAGGGRTPTLADVFRRVSWRDPTLSACSLAGMLNKFSDTAVWGLLPVAMAEQGWGPGAIGRVAGLYALVWGSAQLGTGALSDRTGRKAPVVAGLILNAAGLVVAAFAHGLAVWSGGAALAGLGTALVYPVLLAAVSDAVHPLWRGTALGVYRFWRDGGYALGALVVGTGAAWLAPRAAFVGVGVLLLASAGAVAARMRETVPCTALTAGPPTRRRRARRRARRGAGAGSGTGPS